MMEVRDDENGFGNVPENRTDYQPYDIYRKLTPKERREMQEQIEKDTVRYATELDEKILPMMPTTKKADVFKKRLFLGIMASRQAKLDAQKRWLKAEQAKHREE